MKKQIIITHCSNVEYWYRSLVGKVFWVSDSEYNSKYKVFKGEGTNVEFLLDKSDCSELFEVGEKVHYISTGKKENGIVKSIPDQFNVFVVYHCNEDWKNYNDYTAAKTPNTLIKKGWV